VLAGPPQAGKDNRACLPPDGNIAVHPAMTVRLVDMIVVDDDLKARRLRRWHGYNWCMDRKFDFAAHRPYDRTTA
jgi:hypothetical protein